MDFVDTKWLTSIAHCIYLLSCVADQEELNGQEPEASEETDRARAGQGRGSEVSVCQFV